MPVYSVGFYLCLYTWLEHLQSLINWKKRLTICGMWEKRPKLGIWKIRPKSIYKYAKGFQTYTHHAILAGRRRLALVSNLSHVPSVLQRSIHFPLSCLVFVYFKIYFKIGPNCHSNVLALGLQVLQRGSWCSRDLYQQAPASYIVFVAYWFSVT